MRKSLGVCLAASLALIAGAAGASEQTSRRTVYVPAGTVVVFVPSGARMAMAEPVAIAVPVFPMARLISQQQHMVRRMMAEMDAMMMPLAGPGFMAPWAAPQVMPRWVMDGVPDAGASGVIVRSVTTGNGTCSETITYGPGADGRPPVVNVSLSGNACGDVAPAGRAGPRQIQSPAPHRAPAITPGMQAPRIWTVSNPPQPVAPPRG